jgi:hypothetical protein
MAEGMSPGPENGSDLQPAVRALALIASEAAKARKRRSKFDHVQWSNHPDFEFAQSAREQMREEEAKLTGALIVLETLPAPGGYESWAQIAKAAEEEVGLTGVVIKNQPPREDR